MQSSNILFLDQEFDICIWSGSETTGNQCDHIRNACATLAEQRAASRFPVPIVMTAVEGLSDARWLCSRLIPSHKDSEAEQLWSFPALRALPAKSRAVLLAKFPKTDDLSFSQYYRALFS